MNLFRAKDIGIEQLWMCSYRISPLIVGKKRPNATFGLKFVRLAVQFFQKKPHR